jgi:hypothetical protein
LGYAEKQMGGTRRTTDVAEMRAPLAAGEIGLASEDFRPTAVAGGAGWLVSRRFDMAFLIGNAVIVPFVLLLVALDVSGDVLDAAVTALVGGPHLFATFSASASNRTFRARHRWAVPSAALIPMIVVWLALRHYQILISLFLGVASVHVLHQCAYLSDLYRARSVAREGRWSRFLDFGVVFASMYPIALYKIVRGELVMGGTQIIAPPFLMNMTAVWIEWVLFGSFLLAWSAKSWREWRSGTLHGPKTLLIALTVVLSFIVPGATDAEHTGLAFQSMNAWHSMQYLGLVYLLRVARRGEDYGPLSARLSGLRGGAWFYLGNLAITLLLFGAIKLYARWNPFGTTEGQNYYIFVLSPLLIHYYFDAFGFFSRARLPEPRLGSPSPSVVAA